MKKSSCLWLLCGCLLGAGKPPRQRLVLTAKDAAGEVVVRRNTLIEVQLAAHFGRGYSWQKADSCARLTVGQGSQAEPGGTAAPKPTDSQRFLLLAKRKGTCRLKFLYRQPFDRHTPAQDSITFTLRIR